jgi:hypothetical protein
MLNEKRENLKKIIKAYNAEILSIGQRKTSLIDIFENIEKAKVRGVNNVQMDEI